MTEEQTVEGGLDDPAGLEPEPGTLELAAPEDRHDRADWERAAAGVLRTMRRLGDDEPEDLVWERLARTTLDGVPVTPLGTPELLDGLATSGRPTRAGAWDVRAHLVLGPDPKADNEALLADLQGGVTSLHLSGAGDWATVLEGVLLDLAPVVLDDDAGGFLTFAGDRELHPHTNLGLDARAPDDELAAQARERGIRAYVVDATEVHDRGGSDVQELAFALKVGADHLRAVGGDVDAANALVEFRLAATDEQFATIAKLRAARRLWARVLELSGAATTEQHQHAMTSRPMMSRYDPHVNLLRTTVAAFAAGVAGADAVTVLPFDTPLGRPDAFGRRIARNTSHLLVEEAHVAVVTDPAGGAYAVEKLTDDLAVAAWELFGRLDDGEDLVPLIRATVAERDRQVATRTRPITGLTEFPHLGERLPERTPAPGDDVRRYGAAFEALRADPVTEAVLLTPLGTVAQHTARATFATNLLAVGGIPVTAEPASAARVACVVGTDVAYDEEGAERAAALRESGVAWVVVAGRPREWADDSCAMGVDALAFLARTRERLS